MNLIFFNSQDEFREWLMQNHATETELWVGYYKKGTGKPSMTWSESVDQALCFGWIDGVRYKVDEEGYRIRFTPRKKNSRWSVINVAKVKELQRLGLMMPAGLEAFGHCKEPETAYNSFEAPPSNYKRLVRLAEEVFDVKNDPDQMNVDQEIIQRLIEIHPATVSEQSEKNGPVAWLLVIPTTEEVMKKFLAGKITERELFELTQPGQVYEAVYLCSGLVLEEYRRKGIIKKLALEAIGSIRKDYPVKALFSWAFTEEGDRAAEKIAGLTGLPLFRKTPSHPI